MVIKKASIINIMAQLRLEDLEIRKKIVTIKEFKWNNERIIYY